jgi:hypothetical protein
LLQGFVLNSECALEAVTRVLQKSDHALVALAVKAGRFAGLETGVVGNLLFDGVLEVGHES